MLQHDIWLLLAFRNKYQHINSVWSTDIQSPGCRRLASIDILLLAAGCRRALPYWQLAQMGGSQLERYLGTYPIHANAWFFAKFMCDSLLCQVVTISAPLWCSYDLKSCSPCKLERLILLYILVGVDTFCQMIWFCWIHLLSKCHGLPLHWISPFLCLLCNLLQTEQTHGSLWYIKSIWYI